MNGLLIKDFLVIIKQLKLFLLVIPVMAIIGGASTASVAVLIGAILPMVAIAYDEQSKWHELAIMMPYSKKEMILSKYLLGYLGIASTAIIFIITQLVLSSIKHSNIGDSLFLFYFAICSGLFLIAINTPILLKFGAQKGRFVFIAFMGIVAASESIIRNLSTGLLCYLPDMFPLLLFLLAIIMNIVSILISVHMKQA